MNRRAMPVVWALMLQVAACATVEEPKVAAGWDADQADQPLTHADCVRLAVRFAPTSAAWQARLDAARAALAQAGTLPNPLLALTFDGFPWSAAAPASLLTTTISLGAQLDELFSTSYREAVASHELAATIADLQVERRRLSIDVCRAYDRLLASRRRVELETRLAESTARQRAIAAQLQAAGKARELDAARAAADAAQASADREVAADEARHQEIAFAFALGYREPVPLQLADALQPPADAGAGLQQLLADASRQRPELAAANERYAAALARANLKATSIRFLPAVSLGVEPAQGHTLGFAEINAELPVFDNGEAEEDAASADLLAAAAGARRAAHAVAAEVTADADRSHSAARFLAGHAGPIALLRAEVAAAAEREFAAGGLPFHELLQAQRDLAAAQRAAADAELAAALTAWPFAIDALLAAEQAP
jgi:cobalt-zinc-cadmium efflux system outer membrane protein